MTVLVTWYHTNPPPPPPPPPPQYQNAICPGNEVANAQETNDRTQTIFTVSTVSRRGYFAVVREGFI